MRLQKIILPLITVSLSFLLMTGCANTTNNTKTEQTATKAMTNENEAEPSDSASSDSVSSYPIVIAHAFGETILEEKPERIVTIGWGNQDTPLALGVAPVGVSAANYGLVTEHNLHPWTDEAFSSLLVEQPMVFDDVDGLDFEAISDASPDVILASYSGITEEDYALLSEIAPVVAYPDKPWQTYWRDQTILNATGMGMKEAGEAKVAEIDALIAEKTSKYPALSGTKAAFFWISPDDFSSFYVYLPADPRAAYLNDLGLSFPDSVLAMAENSSDFSITVSRENADQLADVEMMVVYGDEALLEALQADELMSQIPAIKNGAVVLVNSTSALAGATTPSILSIPYEIDEYLDLLSNAQGNIK